MLHPLKRPIGEEGEEGEENIDKQIFITLLGMHDLLLRRSWGNKPFT